MSVPRPCPNCSTPVPATARHCPHCGADVPPSDVPAEGEPGQTPQPRASRSGRSSPTRDLVYYAAFIMGTIVGVLGARQMGYDGIVPVIAGVVIGAGCGFVAERSFFPPKPPAPADEPPPPPAA